MGDKPDITTGSFFGFGQSHAPTTPAIFDTNTTKRIVKKLLKQWRHGLTTFDGPSNILETTATAAGLFA